MDHPVDHNDPKSQKEYFEFCKTISLKGKLYRRFFLYPRLKRYISGKALDIGCGLGSFQKYHKNCVGIDINPFLVDYCLEQSLESYLIKSPPYPFQDNQFDSLFLDNVIEHIEDPSGILNESYRILKEGGNFVIGVPTMAGFKAYADHKTYYDIEKLSSTLEEYNFQLIKYFYTPFKSEYLENNMRAHCLYAVFQK